MTNETARERVADALRRTDTEGFSPEIEQVFMDYLPELLRIPTCNSEIIDELLSLKPFLESHHCKTTVIDKAVELLRITEAGGGIYHRMRWYADHADKRPLNIELLKADCAEAAARLEARPTVIEGDALREALDKIAAGSILGVEMFEQRVRERKGRLTWHAVNVLQDNLAACEGTARAALAVSLEQLKEK